MATPCIFKMESHNHPSYIEPYQGAATGVGGILRDVFTMGARPIANLNALRFGRPDHPEERHLVAGVVAGIGGYGNCVGVPTVGGEVNFDAGVRRQHPGQRDDGRRRRGPTRFSIRPRPASAIRSSMSDRRPAATASTARPWRAPTSPRTARKSAHGSGRRPVHGEIADRGLPRADGDRRHRRDPGHGRGGADKLIGRDGLERAAPASGWT